VYAKLKSDAFGLDDLKELTADMGMDWDSLTGDNKETRALSLALAAARENRVLELVERMKKARPHLFV
jgi:hypothetical protein